MTVKARVYMEGKGWRVQCQSCGQHIIGGSLDRGKRFWSWNSALSFANRHVEMVHR